ncbi:ABC transporter ATP-binding protein [Microtetraspora fusca]|uniref:ABC transporter ATP-binding protein n=1 Tax=Microtetraspora fusca TaxID=1997 RepID=UPI00082D612A|nr:ABC transporter ATP-binding protein [Microtetraspora fusca]
MALLEVRGLCAGYGAVPALDDVSFHVERGEIVALLGGNGAGKTTVARSVSGLHRASSGKVLFYGRDITRCGPQRIVQLGLSHVSDGRRVFPSLTVEENLDLGAYLDGRRKNVVAERREGVYRTFPRLAERRTQHAGSLSGGEQQMLVIGRGLMSEPSLLVLDEPSAGLAPTSIAALGESIAAIRAGGTAVVLIEQHLQVALQLADRLVVLQEGHVILSGRTAEVAADPRIGQMYFGDRNPLKT